MRRSYGFWLMTVVVLGALLSALPSEARPLQQEKGRKKPAKGVGIVYGRVLKPDGKPLIGSFLMIENLELGMIYRKDLNPLGQFQFDDVFPGTYSFKLSPAVYLIKSPAKVVAKAEEAVEVEVRVVPAPVEGKP